MILEAARRVLQIEADSVREQIGNLGPEFERAVEEVATSPGRLCVTGLGKSGLIGQKLAATLASTGTPAYFLHAAEASHGDLGMLVAGDTVLALSFSGETPEVVRLIEFANARGLRTIAMSGRAGLPRRPRRRPRHLRRHLTRSLPAQSRPDRLDDSDARHG